MLELGIDKFTKCLIIVVFSSWPSIILPQDPASINFPVNIPWEQRETIFWDVSGLPIQPSLERTGNGRKDQVCSLNRVGSKGIYLMIILRCFSFLLQWKIIFIWWIQGKYAIFVEMVLKTNKSAAGIAWCPATALTSSKVTVLNLCTSSSHALYLYQVLGNYLEWHQGNRVDMISILKISKGNNSAKRYNLNTNHIQNYEVA